ncbi:hypothetical protein ACFY1P_20340 [Streptomyces sp. NPDC001407]|uniref:hypothetical protein n=1 Tax=Streptomyces sp. NPDC001407 TaxID=3364573 RepID=UPI0036AECB2D
MVAAALRPGGVFVLATMAEHADGTPASPVLSCSSALLPQDDGAVVTLPRWVLSLSLWQHLLDRDFTVQHRQRLANPDHPKQAVASWLIRAVRR